MLDVLLEVKCLGDHPKDSGVKNNKMPELSLFSQISLYLLLIVIGLLTMFIWDWQIMILKGKAIKNPDGSSDDWQEHEDTLWYRFC